MDDATARSPDPMNADQMHPDHPQEDGDAATAAKAALRRELRAARRAALSTSSDRGAAGLRTAAAPLLPRLIELARSANTVTIVAFWPSPTEPDVLAVVTSIREAVEAEGAMLHVLFPAASGGPDLAWIDGDERDGAAPSAGRGFGDEPAGDRWGPDAVGRADLILAPALAVDRSGTRLGHGGGYYDRALPRRRPGTPVVAVVHPQELLGAGALVRADHDVPVDAVLTVEGLTAVGSA